MEKTRKLEVLRRLNLSDRGGELALIHVVQILSVLLFSAGFFLTRPEIHSHSPTDDALAHLGLKRFNRTVILLVDALRYDFLCPMPSMFCRVPPQVVNQETNADHGSDEPYASLQQHMQPYHNNVPFVAESLRDYPENNLLMKFVADPPTTTMQRIKEFNRRHLKKAGIMNIKSVKLNENLKANFFFPDFNDDVAIIKERKTCFGWVAEPPFSIPRQLLVFIIAIENLPEVSVPYKQTTVDFYENHIENKTLQVSDNMELSRSVRAQFCDYELSYRPMYENQLGFFEEERELKFLWCVSDEYDNLQEQKPDRDCDEWENGSLTESIIASIEEENALDPKLDNKKSDQAVPFACFSTDTGQDALKEVQGASSVENNSIKSARTILSTVLNDYTDYQDHILSNEASEKISEKTSLKSEQPASCTQKTVKRRAPAVNNPERVGSKNSDGDENEDNMCPPSCKLRRAAELYSN